ncbi:hypothetical protein EVAR_52292_1 [Eumeta japonica]|uniref:Uncharacterized protein n=1 Tax=Eumeta variegata TaxID=151549 RepID=A0A4C1Y4I1_EUMVA|nr:hypothetical protein EVAR_52292_1 [Eumeta japonica]
MTAEDVKESEFENRKKSSSRSTTASEHLTLATGATAATRVNEAIPALDIDYVWRMRRRPTICLLFKAASLALCSTCIRVQFRVRPSSRELVISSRYDFFPTFDGNRHKVFPRSGRKEKLFSPHRAVLFTPAHKTYPPPKSALRPRFRSGKIHFCLNFISEYTRPTSK